MKFGIGVLGATGYIGTAYRREIRESPLDARIVALHGRRRDLLEAAGKEDQAQLVTDDWRQVVDHPEVNLIVVCTPDAYHREAVMRCAALGKHLICEKPIGANAKEAKEMWDAVRKTGAGHYVPFWTRYVPVCVRARSFGRGFWARFGLPFIGGTIPVQVTCRLLGETTRRFLRLVSSPMSARTLTTPCAGCWRPKRLV